MFASLTFAKQKQGISPDFPTPSISPRSLPNTAVAVPCCSYDTRCTNAVSYLSAVARECRLIDVGPKGLGSVYLILILIFSAKSTIVTRVPFHQ